MAINEDMETKNCAWKYPYKRSGIGLAGNGMSGPSGTSGKKDFLYMMLMGIWRPKRERKKLGE